ncbi:site-2 protease family protein [Niveibacterium sp. 24ML]|uniref:site-2 protease family protein n=1 Tax=Niveibacterium sp. 24ML TaxID=2985512 RepID=UPI00226DBF27|nr:site-2 protease family protein [Niveibacterium sp. 24ML]MCX9156946.1 site-2 protease family protein [Niveibacterium sp. 24ML]
MDIVLTILVWAPPILLAITLHEAAHGYAARHFGDPTAYLAGRISLNPLRHIDPVGTIAVPLGIVLMNHATGASFPPFGWAKAVPVNSGRLRNPKRDMLWVAAAGPGANLALALGWGLMLSLQSALDGYGGDRFFEMGQVGILVNLGLMLLNLLPIPPLDGGRIAISLLPGPLAWKFARIEPYGFIILIALLYLRVLDYVLWPLIPPLRQIIALVTGA